MILSNSQSIVMRDCLDTCFELIKLIKFSSKHEAMLKKRLEVAVLRYIRCVKQDGQFVQIPSPLF